VVEAVERSAVPRGIETVDEGVGGVAQRSKQGRNTAADREDIAEGKPGGEEPHYLLVRLRIVAMDEGERVRTEVASVEGAVQSLQAPLQAGPASGGLLGQRRGNGHTEDRTELLGRGSRGPGFPWDRLAGSSRSSEPATESSGRRVAAGA